MPTADGTSRAALVAAREDEIRDWQRSAGDILIAMLCHGTDNRLPVISWKVTEAAPQLSGSCEGHPESRRLTDFATWVVAITTLAGPPNHYLDHTHVSPGMTGAVAVWTNYQRVVITLSANWWDAHVAAEQSSLG